MFTPALLAHFDQERRRTTEGIRRYGSWHTYVFEEPALELGPGTSDDAGWGAFCYTTGLYGVGHPELLVFSLDRRTSALLLNGLVDQVRRGRDLTPGEHVHVEAVGLTVLVETVPNPGEIVFAANEYWARPSEASVPVLQLTWADPGGRFPWQPGCAAPASCQPRPGRFRA